MAAKEETVIVYVDGPGKFRWRRKSTNGVITATAGDSYSKRKTCTEMAVKVNRPPFKLVEVDPSFTEIRTSQVE